VYWCLIVPGALRCFHVVLLHRPTCQESGRGGVSDSLLSPSPTHPYCNPAVLQAVGGRWRGGVTRIMSAGERESKIEMAELRDSARHGVRKPRVAWEGGGRDGGDGGRRWEERGGQKKK
jgi:hypothetical protein